MVISTKQTQGYGIRPLIVEMTPEHTLFLQVCHTRNNDMIKEMYKFVTDEKQEWQCIGIAKGRYEGVVYKYGKVTIPTEEDVNLHGDLPFRFEYDIVDSNGLERDWFQNDFFKLIGDILVDIITNEENNIGSNN